MTNVSTINRRSGEEGPKHDPYHYDEITVRRQDGRKVVLHLGLGEWLSIKLPEHPLKRLDATGAKLNELFEHWSGISIQTALRTLDRRSDHKIRKHACGSKHLEWVSGFPGEHLLMCTKCRNIIDSTFNIKEIE